MAYNFSSIRTVALAAFLLLAAAAQPSQPPPVQPAAPTPASSDTPLTAAEKPLVGRWTIDRAAAVAMLKQAHANHTFPANLPFPATDEGLAENIEETMGDVHIDLLPTHAFRTITATKLVRGTWSLHARDLTLNTSDAQGTPTVAALVDGKLIVQGPTGIEGLKFPFARSDFGPAPSSSYLIGTWKVDIDRFKASARPRLATLAKSHPGKPDDTDATLDMVAKQLADMAFSFFPGGSQETNCGYEQTHSGNWSVDGDTVVTTDNTLHVTTALIFRNYRLVGNAQPIFEIEFVRVSNESQNIPDHPAPAKPQRPAAERAAVEKPLIGRWVFDSSATAAAIAKAKANGTLHNAQGWTDRFMRSLFHEDFEALCFDLFADHQQRLLLRGGKTYPGEWWLDGDNVHLTLPAHEEPIKSLTFTQNTLIARFPSTDFPVFLKHVEVGPTPSADDLVGTWKVDLDLHKKQALELLDGNDPPTPADLAWVNRETAFRAQLTLVLNSDHTGAIDYGDNKPVAARWAIDTDLVFLTFKQQQLEATYFFVFRDHRLTQGRLMHFNIDLVRTKP